MPKVEVKIIRVGNSLGVRLPKGVLLAAGLKEGDNVNFEFQIEKPKITAKTK